MNQKNSSYYFFHISKVYIHMTYTRNFHAVQIQIIRSNNYFYQDPQLHDSYSIYVRKSDKKNLTYT